MGNVEWLSDVIGSTVLQRGFGIVKIGMAGQEHKLAVTFFFPQPAQQVQTTAAGHLDITQDDIRLAGADLILGFGIITVSYTHLHLKEEEAIRTEEQKATLSYLETELEISPIDNPYDYVKELQSRFDNSGIEYSDEYYDVLGIDRK